MEGLPWPACALSLACRDWVVCVGWECARDRPGSAADKLACGRARRLPRARSLAMMLCSLPAPPPPRLLCHHVHVQVKRSACGWQRQRHLHLHRRRRAVLVGPGPRVAAARPSPAWRRETRDGGTRGSAGVATPALLLLVVGAVLGTGVGSHVAVHAFGRNPSPTDWSVPTAQLTVGVTVCAAAW